MMNKIFITLAVLVCLGCYEVSAIKVVPCKGPRNYLATVKNIDVVNCTSVPCVFKRGQESSIKVEFQANSRITDLKLNILGAVQSKSVPFPINDNNHCLNTIQELKNTTKCLLQRRKTYNYEFKLPVLETYPAISVFVDYRLKFGDKTVFCFQFPLKLV